MLNSVQITEKLTAVLINTRSAVISNKINGDTPYIKVTAEAFEGKEGLSYKFSFYTENKVTHKIVSEDELAKELIRTMELGFKQCNIFGENNITLLMNKKHNFTLLKIKKGTVSDLKGHNREKNHILKNGEYVSWAYHVGLTDKDGIVLSHMQKKFRQINKFLEMLADIESNVPENSVIIDMGCGKSYLTFAVYHYFNTVKNKNVFIRGYDLKEQVVENCNKIAENCGFDRLKFYCDNIENVNNESGNISMIISLHACDTATDYAIYHGIRWGCKVMMNVPCCQHEIFKQIDKKAFPLMLGHGILKERFSALLTDSIRARIIELCGYKTDVVEFIDTEHTPKNIMLRSVKNDKGQNAEKLRELEEILAKYSVTPTLYTLAKKGGYI